MDIFLDNPLAKEFILTKGVDSLDQMQDTDIEALLTTVTTDEEKAEIQTYIDARLTEINASKKKSVVINYSALPADLAAKFSK
jgi:hypothetical protein